MKVHFSGQKIEKNGKKLIKGHFNFDPPNQPIWYKDFAEPFFLYDIGELEDNLIVKSKNFKKLSLGPYLPWEARNKRNIYPYFSKIVMDSKHKAMEKITHSNDFNKGAKEGLEILTHLFSHILLDRNLISNYDFIVPVPCKPKYQDSEWDGVHVASGILSKFLKIPTYSFFRRIDNEISEFEVIGEISLNGKNIIIFDDVFKDGETKSKLIELLSDKNVSNILILTIGIKDTNIYE